MEVAVTAGAAGFSLTARRNCSLTTTERHVALGLIYAVSFAIAAAFALLGAWPILPFAGLEMAAVCLAFRWMDGHAGDFERLTVDGDRVTIETADREESSRFEFNRHWAQVVFARDRTSGRLRLALRSHGREVEFGRHLSDAQRAQLARELRRRFREHREHEYVVKGDA
jgi:uncharacterized membrane protein